MGHLLRFGEVIAKRHWSNDEKTPSAHAISANRLKLESGNSQGLVVPGEFPSPPQAMKKIGNGCQITCAQALADTAACRES